MDAISERFLDTFDRLPQAVQWQIASAILRKTRLFDLPPLQDDDLVLLAEGIFLELDTREESHEQTTTW